jgi:hypothetical protein
METPNAASPEVDWLSRGVDELEEVAVVLWACGFGQWHDGEGVERWWSSRQH